MKSQNGEEKSKWNTWLWLFYFLAHFAFPIVKHWHVLKTAILTVVDMTILRYEERIVRLVQKETAEEKKKKKKNKKKNTRSRIVENFLHWKRFTCKWKRGRVCRKPIIYTREIPRSRCTVSKSTESRNTVVKASSGKRHISYKRARATETDKKRTR